MDELNTKPIITDEAIEEVLPTEEEIAKEKKPITEAEVEVEVGGDEPVDETQNMNIENEEEEKQTDPLL